MKTKLLVTSILVSLMLCPITCSAARYRLRLYNSSGKLIKTAMLSSDNTLVYQYTSFDNNGFNPWSFDKKKYKRKVIHKIIVSVEGKLELNEEITTMIDGREIESSSSTVVHNDTIYKKHSESVNGGRYSSNRYIKGIEFSHGYYANGRSYPSNKKLTKEPTYIYEYDNYSWENINDAQGNVLFRKSNTSDGWNKIEIIGSYYIIREKL